MEYLGEYIGATKFITWDLSQFMTSRSKVNPFLLSSQKSSHIFDPEFQIEGLDDGLAIEVARPWKTEPVHRTVVFLLLAYA